MTRFAVLGLGAVAILAIPAFGTPKIRRAANRSGRFRLCSTAKARVFFCAGVQAQVWAAPNDRNAARD